MRIVIRCFSALILLAFGYALGANAVFLPNGLQAQDAETPATEDEPSEENQEKIREAYATLKSAATALTSDEMYQSAAQGVNGFAVTVGGLNALDDLEAGRGVDPETFGALYAGMGTDAVVEHLSKDDQGRLTYKGKVVRMYPISRLKKLYARRIKYSGEEAADGGL